MEIKQKFNPNNYLYIKSKNKKAGDKMKNKPKRYAIIGLDGSGKSTNIEKIINDEKYKEYKKL